MADEKKIDEKVVKAPAKKEEPSPAIPLEGKSQTTMPDGTVRTDY